MLQTKTCKKCGNEVIDRAKFCNMCRSTEFKESMSCPNCDMELPADSANFCPGCGKKVKSDAKIKMKGIIAPDGEKQTCLICRNSITDSTLVVCPSCLNPFHFPHLANWIISHNSCPTCKTKLEFND